MPQWKKPTATAAKGKGRSGGAAADGASNARLNATFQAQMVTQMKALAAMSAAVSASLGQQPTDFADAKTGPATERKPPRPLQLMTTDTGEARKGKGKGKGKQASNAPLTAATATAPVAASVKTPPPADLALPWTCRKCNTKVLNLSGIMKQCPIGFCKEPRYPKLLFENILMPKARTALSFATLPKENTRLFTAYACVTAAEDLKAKQEAAVALAVAAEAQLCEETAGANNVMDPMEEDTESVESAVEAPSVAAWDATTLKAETAAIRARIQDALKSDLPADIKEPTLIYLRKKLAALPTQAQIAATTAPPGNLRRDLAEAQVSLANMEEAKKEILLQGRTQEAAQEAIILAAQTELQAIRFRGGALLEGADCAIKRAAEVLAKINELLEAESPPTLPPVVTIAPHVGEQKTLALLQGVLETCELGPEVAKFIHDKMHVAFALASITTPIPTDTGEALQPFAGSTKPDSLEDEEPEMAEDGAKPRKINKTAPGSVGANFNANAAASSLDFANGQWENA
jgi:uncharacterized metal-binding protein